MKMLAKRILVLLDEEELSQRDLAKLLNLNYNTVNGYVTNRRTPDCETIIRIAQCLDSSIDYLVGLSDIRNLKGLGLTKGEYLLISNYRSLSTPQKRVLEELSDTLRKNELHHLK